MPRFPQSQVFSLRYLFSLMLGAALLLVVAPCPATILHVDDNASAGGDGLTWNTAYRFLQDALAVAATSDEVTEIRVAQGIYRPDETEGDMFDPGDRNATFALIDGVALQGGYAGLGMPDPDERDVDLYITSLSGDLLDNDESPFLNYSDNSYHVVTVSGIGSTAVLDGFTVRSGNATGAGDLGLGGGVFITFIASPIINHCKMVENIAGQGGGMASKTGSQPSVIDCIFQDNHANTAGGGMINLTSAPIVTDCQFIDNTVDGLGGAGVFNHASNVLFSSCSFNGNATPAKGGGMFNSGGVFTLLECTFDGNRAFDGAGLYCSNTSAVAPMISDCQFQNNFALHCGSGMYCTNLDSDCYIERCDFTGNLVIDDGAGLWTDGIFTTYLDDCTFQENSAGDRGGGAFFHQTLAELTQCIFEINLSYEYGGAVYHWGGGTIYSDCTFSENNSYFEGGGIYIYLTNAEFTDCMWFGNTSEGNGAAFNNFQGEPTLTNCAFHENSALGQGAGFYNNSGNPVITYCVFQDNECGPCNEGSCIGGSGGGMYNVGQSYPTLSYCEFDSNFSKLGGAIYISSGCGGDISHCQFSNNWGRFGGAIFLSERETAATSIDNCHFSDNVSGTWGGGAIYVYQNDLTITNSTFTGNTANSGKGGAVYLERSDFTVESCSFEGNYAGETGGAVHTEFNEHHLTDCTFLSNAAGDKGGGLYMKSAVTTVIDTRFNGNQAAQGGGVYHAVGIADYTNCLFSGNQATEVLVNPPVDDCAINTRGAAFAGLYSTTSLTNCTFSMNRAECEGKGGGISGVIGEFTNCIFWNNEDSGGVNEPAQIYDCQVTVHYSCIHGLSGAIPGEGNIGLNPIFIDPSGADGVVGTEDDNLALAHGSSCIDAADNGGLPPEITTDLDGNMRFVDDPYTADTGLGIAPIVDMGALEYAPDECPADLNGDNTVSIEDIFVTLGYWGTCVDPCPPSCTADINWDCQVDVNDIFSMLGQFGICP